MRSHVVSNHVTACDPSSIAEAQLNKAKTVAANVNRPGSSSSSNKRRHKEESLEHGVSAAVEENENEDPAAAAAVLAKYMSMEVWDVSERNMRTVYLGEHALPHFRNIFHKW